jgi:hypothetical protein
MSSAYMALSVSQAADALDATTSVSRCAFIRILKQMQTCPTRDALGPAHSNICLDPIQVVSPYNLIQSNHYNAFMIQSVKAETAFKSIPSNRQI